LNLFFTSKTAEFEVKNRFKGAEEAKVEHLLELFCSVCEGNESH